MTITSKRIKTWYLLPIIFLLILLVGCDTVDRITGNEDKGDEYCDLSVDVQHMIQCKYVVEIAMYCSETPDYIDYRWDDFSWRQLPYNGATFEHEFPAPGVYILRVAAYRHGDIIAEFERAITIDCR